LTDGAGVRKPLNSSTVQKNVTQQYDNMERTGRLDNSCDSPGLSDSGGDRIMVPVGGPKDERVEAGSVASLAAI
jgi:hypothetical protein